MWQMQVPPVHTTSGVTIDLDLQQQMSLQCHGHGGLLFLHVWSKGTVLPLYDGQWWGLRWECHWQPMWLLRTGPLLQKMDNNGTAIHMLPLFVLLLAPALCRLCLYGVLQPLYAQGLPLPKRQMPKHVEASYRFRILLGVIHSYNFELSFGLNRIVALSWWIMSFWEGKV